ncbi:hypothetical protein AKJ58_00350 [candidate division MSBL1 archaeon SCGC-AAA385D11]|uniref:Uncharacterized protein n=1 Tax=candidate division MSBL1 archaeon SCGC-AAA385D11 TaxID=1698286 RepID=A0A133VPE5_9EURY|nr:hypothetical protein AKJ58_00350 [candidate division MSBL1 archaeon SCGC-AAA385D11]
MCVSETISTRVPEEIRREVEEFMREEKLDKSAAIRKLLKTGLLEWRKQKALTLLEKGKVTFNKAAEIAGMSVWDFADLLRKGGGNWITSLERIKSDIQAAGE